MCTPQFSKLAGFYIIYVINIIGVRHSDKLHRYALSDYGKQAMKETYIYAKK